MSPAILASVIHLCNITEKIFKLVPSLPRFKSRIYKERKRSLLNEMQKTKEVYRNMLLLALAKKETKPQKTTTVKLNKQRMLQTQEKYLHILHPRKVLATIADS